MYARVAYARVCIIMYLCMCDNSVVNLCVHYVYYVFMYGMNVLYLLVIEN